MNKVIIFFLTLLLSFSSYADTYNSRKYIMVIFHGLGGYEANNLDMATKLPENLKMAGIEKMYNAGHGVSEKKFDVILNNFACKNGTRNQENLGMIIVGYSWGARKSYEFSKTYLKKCGQKADRAYMIDGVQKLVSQFKETPVAKVCKNFYKTISPIRGRDLKNCQNSDLTELCKQEGGAYSEGMPCHQTVLKAGFELVMEDIQNFETDVASLQAIY